MTDDVRDKDEGDVCSTCGEPALEMVGDQCSTCFVDEMDGFRRG